MAQNFQFVDSTSVDKTTRKLIRSHVMKGKNAGKTLSRRPKLKTDRCQRRDQEDERGLCQRHPPHTNRIPRNLGSVFLTMSLPVDLTPRALDISDRYFGYVADRMYPTKLGLPSQEAKAIYLKVMFYDQDTSQCSIALMDAFNEFFLCHGRASPRSLQFLSRTYVVVKKRLESEKALEDSTIGIVITLITQEFVRRETKSAKVHLEGMKRIVDLRGGIDQFEASPGILYKICKTEITCCLDSGEPLTFLRNQMPQVEKALEARGYKLDRHTASCALMHKNLDPALEEILLDVCSIATLFNRNKGKQIFDLLHFQEMSISIYTRLLRFHHLNAPRRESKIEEAYHIGLTIYMMIISLQHDNRRLLDFELVTFILRNLLEEGLGDENAELALWLSLLGGIWTQEDPDPSFFNSRIRILTGILGLGSWEETEDCVRKLPWINILHGEMGQQVWRDASWGMGLSWSTEAFN